MANDRDEATASRPPAPQTGFPGHPLTGLRQQMDRLFDDFLSGWGTSRPGRLFDVQLGADFTAPRVDVVEEEQAVVVTAELPGIDEKDVEVTLDRGVLTIRGEKKSESERQEDRVTVSERRYGSFQRSFSLPEGIDEEKVSARFDKGVLTVRLGRRPEAAPPAKRIPIGG